MLSILGLFPFMRWEFEMSEGCEVMTTRNMTMVLHTRHNFWFTGVAANDPHCYDVQAHHHSRAIYSQQLLTFHRAALRLFRVDGGVYGGAKLWGILFTQCELDRDGEELRGQLRNNLGNMGTNKEQFEELGRNLRNFANSHCAKFFFFPFFWIRFSLLGFWVDFGACDRRHLPRLRERNGRKPEAAATPRQRASK